MRVSLLFFLAVCVVSTLGARTAVDLWFNGTLQAEQTALNDSSSNWRLRSFFASRLPEVALAQHTLQYRENTRQCFIHLE